MRGRISYEEVHEFVSKFVDLSVEQFNEFLLKGIGSIKLNKDLMQLSHEMQEKGVKTAVFTDNMDVFDRVLVPHYGLDDKFDAIISSAKHGLLKHDENGKLFDIAIKELNSTPEKTLIIDDSIDLKPMIESKGASFYHYENYGEEFAKFKKYMKKYL
jgi:FMN phosphatase YigB (HAD superfamily)